MSNFSKMLHEMPKYFEEYYNQVVSKLELENLTQQEQDIISQICDDLFTDAILLACAKVLDEKELKEIEVFIATHPDCTLRDAYFAAASHKDTIDEQIKLEMQKSVVEIEKHYKSLT